VGVDGIKLRKRGAELRECFQLDPFKIVEECCEFEYI